MVNKRFVKKLTDLPANELNRTLRMMRKSRPPGVFSSPPGTVVPRSQHIKDEDMLFRAGDRVQIMAGPDRGKVGRITQRQSAAQGNGLSVSGVGGTKVVHPIEIKALAGEQYDPVITDAKVFDPKDLRLVAKIRTDSGRDEDVAIHSLALGRPRYDARSNTFPRVRYARHDPSIEIPFQLEAAKPIESPLTTPAPSADLRTHYVTSALEPPVPIGAVDQITNVNSRHKRGRYEPARAPAPAPQMPVPPQTRELFAAVAALPRAPATPFTREVEDFVGAEIKKGLRRRAEREAAALEQYR